VEALVDLRGIDELHAVTADGDDLRIGAMVSCARLWRVRLEQLRPRVLVEAAASVGSRLLQNHVTVGGNCVALYAWSDLPVALLCLRATMVLRGQGGEREVPAEDFFASHPSKALEPGELLVQVRVPAVDRTGSAYLKFSRNAGDQALASVAARLRLEEGRATHVSLVAGAVRALPQPLEAAAAALLGEVPDAGLIEAAGAAAAEEVKTVSDFKASAEYRESLVGSLVQDALELAVARAGGAA
jgi:carbon-monoxide dehydrogenase medium subunit